MIVKTCKYTHPDIGPIHVKVNAQSRSIRARWVGPEVQITIPQNLPVDEYNRFIDEFGLRIKANKPRSRYYNRQIIEGNFADFEVRVCTSGVTPDYFITQEDDHPLRGKKRNYIINISRRLAPDYSFDTPRLENIVNTMLKHCAAKACADFLIPHARELASHIERFPLGWDIKDSRTRLGCCSSRGIITLSPRLIFLPTHLADYIIYHELAHLSEMNHSAAFHEVCDSYCDGKEEQYRAEVKAFKFPVF